MKSNIMKEFERPILKEISDRKLSTTKPEPAEMTSVAAASMSYKDSQKDYNASQSEYAELRKSRG